MIIETLPLIAFVFAGLFSPGPNVVMLTASGARFGFRATIPHFLGVPIGTGIIAALSATGIGAALEAAPSLRFTLQIAAAAWILWLAFRTAQAGRAGRGDDRGKPFTFVQAILFQAVNPKIWAVTLAASAGFGIGLGPIPEATRMFLAFAGINLAVCMFWTSAGHLMRGLLASDTIWRRFMLIMAIMMASTTILIFI